MYLPHGNAAQTNSAKTNLDLDQANIRYLATEWKCKVHYNFISTQVYLYLQRVISAEGVEEFIKGQ